MIFDKIENIELYFQLGERIKQALIYIRETDFTKLKTGKHNIDGDKLFVLVNEYKTKDISECVMEAHKKYIDLQYMYKGCEKIACSILTDQEPTKNYDSENDYSLYKPFDFSIIKLETGTFALFFPDDIHMPGIVHNESKNIKKIVVKILI